MHRRSGSTRPCSASQRAAAMQSSTSATPHDSRSRLRYARPNPVEPRWFTSTTANPRDVQYCTPSRSAGIALAVGPPWIITSRGGREPGGPVNPGLTGG